MPRTQALIFGKPLITDDRELEKCLSQDRGIFPSEIELGFPGFQSACEEASARLRDSKREVSAYLHLNGHVQAIHFGESPGKSIQTGWVFVDRTKAWTG